MLVGVGGLWLWRTQQQITQRNERKLARLDHYFYQLLEPRQGRISALELAMNTGLSSKEASQYLHHQAQDFGAYFERTRTGDVVYVFNLAVIYAWPTYQPQPYLEPTPTELGWASYAERASEPSLNPPPDQGRHQQHTARANARQISALRNLSQSAKPASPAPSVRQLPPASNELAPQAEQVAQTFRGRAAVDPDHVITIDVPAVNG